MNYQLQQTGDQVQEILNQAPTTEQNLQSEITRSTTKDEQLETAIGNEKTRAEGVESNLQTAIGNEVTRAEGAESNLQTAIANEKTRAELIEGGLRTDVDAIKAEIPTQASPENQLADKAFVNSSIATNTAEFKGTYNSLEDLQTQVQDANANDYAFVVSTDAAGNTVYNRYKYVEGTGWVFEYSLNNSSFTSAQWAAIQSGITAALVAKLVGLPTATELATQMNQIIDSVTAENTRAEGIESGLRTDVNANAAAIVAEKNRAEGVEGTLSTAIGTEKGRAEGAETILQQNIDAEALARGNADTTLQGEIDTINGKIPSQATASNQLADKAFVNSSIATNTADFKGTYNSLQELEAVTANNNDYGFVVSTDAAGNTVYNRYKYVEGTGWVFEYALNNSSFTSAQWAAIQSGITAALVTKLTNLPDNTALTAMFTAITSLIPSAASSDNKLVDYAQLVASLATKQDTLTFDDAPTQSSTNPVKSGGVYTAIATVTTALNLLDQSKQDKLTFDNTPTTGSDNPVKSQGIKSYVDAETTRAQNAESALSGRVTTAEGNITTLQGQVATKASQADLNAAVARISTNETDIANLQQLYNNLQQSKPEPVTALPSTGQQQGVIYRLAGTTSYSDYMWNGSTWVLMATYNNAIDNVPTAGSDNLVKSGGVYPIKEKIDNTINEEQVSVATEILKTSYDVTSQHGYILSSETEIQPSDAYMTYIITIPNSGYLYIDPNNYGNTGTLFRLGIQRNSGTTWQSYYADANAMPTSANKLEVLKDDVMYVTIVDGSSKNFIFQYEYQATQYTLTDEIIQGIFSKEKITIHYVNNTMFEVVVPQIGNDSVIKHNFIRQYAENNVSYGEGQSKNMVTADIWYPYQILVNGENAIQGNLNFIYRLTIEGAHVGAGHGCEVSIFTNFLADGVLFNPTQPFEDITCDVFRVVLKSNMYATSSPSTGTNAIPVLDNNGDPIITAIHTLNAAYRVNNVIDWENNLLIQRDNIKFLQLHAGMVQGQASKFDVVMIEDSQYDANKFTWGGSAFAIETIGDSVNLKNNPHQVSSGVMMYGKGVVVKQTMERLYTIPDENNFNANYCSCVFYEEANDPRLKVYMQPSRTDMVDGYEARETFNSGDWIRCRLRREIEVE